jgi:dipeptidyl aminopeptidase/acylaminoacyl peptidase
MEDAMASGPTVAPYGSWKSPITTDLITGTSISLGQVAVDGETIYWSEGRPTERGRYVVVKRTADGRVEDVTPAPFNVRTRVHEYGGGAFVVDEGTVYFSNFADQRVYRQDPGAVPRPLTPNLDLRYANAIVDRRRERLICVREDHTDTTREAINTLVGLDLEQGGPGEVLVSGSDFYSSPRLSPDGTRLAWLTWNHPNMPWDGNELWVGTIGTDGTIEYPVLVAGGLAESIFQPEWSPDGMLTFVSDRNGWWNPYYWRDGQVEPVLEVAAEVGLPEWVFGLSTCAHLAGGGPLADQGILAERGIACTYSERGQRRIAVVDPASHVVTYVETPYASIGELRASPTGLVYVGASPTEPATLLEHGLPTGVLTTIRRSSTVTVDPGYVSIPRQIEFPTEQNRTAFAYYYAPANRDFVAPAGERPPLLVISHGGPTSATSTAFSLNIQYWTSRGFAVVDVNYGGSTGYGRAYRQRLNGQWGIVDVDDCVNVARYLVSEGLADASRLAIRGGSAGGYTTLAALTFRDIFQAGASYYGVSDLEALATDTHKFESRYLDSMVGPYPQRRDLYVERSPIHFTDRLTCPIIFFQGLEDKVVPPSQAELMVDALRAKKLPVAYLAFEGEQHGFRQAATIKRTLEAELYFYSRIFGFPLADPVEPVTIENLD